MVDGLNQAAGLDGAERGLQAWGPSPEPGRSVIVFEADGLVVSAFTTQEDAFNGRVGYRFDYRGRSIVVGGDGRMVGAAAAQTPTSCCKARRASVLAPARTNQHDRRGSAAQAHGSNAGLVVLTGADNEIEAASASCRSSRGGLQRRGRRAASACWSSCRSTTWKSTSVRFNAARQHDLREGEPTRLPFLLRPATDNASRRVRVGSEVTMPDLRLAAIAAHRFGFGPRPGELRTIADDPRGWVKSQLRPATRACRRQSRRYRLPKTTCWRLGVGWRGGVSTAPTHSAWKIAPNARA